MKRHKPLVFILLAALAGCEEPSTGALAIPSGPEKDAAAAEEEAALPAKRLWRNGKARSAPLMTDLYEPAPLDSFDLPIIDGKFIEALENNLQLLRFQQRPQNQQIGNLRINFEELEETIAILKSWQHTKPFGLHQYLDAYKIWGADRRGHVRYTGYFTPVIKVREKRQGPYQYPIYNRPLNWEGTLPSRAEIEGEHVLEGLGLELAYAANKVDVYYMQVQGSGFVEYPDGSRKLLAYNGTNRYPYRSIEKYILSRDDIPITNLSIKGIRSYLKRHPHLQDTILFQNPSYTFFTPKRSVPKGAGSVPLLSDYSIAVDRRYIPLGSCLLAAFPVFDHRRQRVIGHDYRFFVAQDVGGAIKGPGHVDVYTGTGKDAARKAGRINYYGNLWLLLPKQPKAHFISAE